VGQLQSAFSGLCLYVFKPKVTSQIAESYIYIASTLKLDQEMEPNDGLFILTPIYSPLVYAVLRRTGVFGHFKFVAYCSFLYFRANNPIDLIDSPLHEHTISLSCLQRKLDEDLDLVSTAREVTFHQSSVAEIFPGSLADLPSHCNLWSLLPVFFSSERKEIEGLDGIPLDSETSNKNAQRPPNATFA
jgi:hypothetical protein